MICAYRIVDSDEVVHHNSVSSKTLSPTGNTFCDQRKEFFPVPSGRSLISFVFLSFRQPSIRLVGGAERPSSLSKAVPCVRPADPQQRRAQFGTFFLPFFLILFFSFLQTIDSK